MRKNSTLTDLKSKLKGYSAMAGAIVASGAAANADIVYQDVSDVTLTTDGSSFEIDLNCDGVGDARITFNKSSNTSGTTCIAYSNVTLFSNNRSMDMSLLGNASAVTSGGYLGGFFGANNVIGSSATWTTATNQMGRFNSFMLTSIFITGTACNSGFATTSTSTYGPWGNNISQNSKYLGLRMDIDGNTYYGWASISTSGALPKKLSAVTLHSYALNTEPGESINAGFVSGYADSANTVMVADISDNDDGSDLEVSFSLPDTANTGELRVYAVPAGGDTLDMCDAWTLLKSGSYMTVPLSGYADTTGGTINYNLNFSGQNDINGNPVVNGTEYYVYVYSKGNFIFTGPGVTSDANQGVLIKSSNSATLLGKAEPVTAIIAADSSNNDDASDLEVRFTEPANVSKQSEYKVFVVKSASAGSFDEAAANSVAMGNYKTITVSGASTTQTVNYVAGDKDTDGDNIQTCTDYVVFVQSIADGTTADRDTLVGPSSSVILKGQVTAASNIVGSDVGDFMDARDLDYSFDIADIDGISELRVFAVPTSSMPVTADDLALVSSLFYKSITPAAPGTFTGNMVGVSDYTGSPITNGVDYTIHVLSMNDGVCVNLDNVGNASTGVTLSTIYPETVDGTTIIPVDTADDRKPSDMHVTFTGASDESAIIRYHIVVSNSFNADFFMTAGGVDFATQMKSDGYLTSIPATGAGTYETVLDVTQADELGNKITNYKSYNVFILSEGKPGVTDVYTLSDSSDAIILTDKTGIEDELNGKVTVSSAQRNVRVVIDPSLKMAGYITIHNSLGQVIESKNIVAREMWFNNVANDKGVYFVSVVIDGKRITKKVFIY